MLVMLAITSIMATGLASCDKEDGPDENRDFSNDKKLVKIVYQEVGDEDVEVTTFKYGVNGRLIEVVEDEMKSSFVWEDDEVKIHTEYYFPSSFNTTQTLSLANGLAQTSCDYGRLSYNQSNRLVKYEENARVLDYVWEGNKLMSVTEDGFVMSITYSQYCKKGYFPLLDEITEWLGGYLCYAHPELFGLRTVHLPSSVSYIDDNRVVLATYSYAFDNEGYITKITQTFNGEGEETDYLPYTDTYTLTWE